MTPIPDRRPGSRWAWGTHHVRSENLFPPNGTRRYAPRPVLRLAGAGQGRQWASTMVPGALGTVQIHVTSERGADPVFAGIAPAAAAGRYLAPAGNTVRGITGAVTGIPPHRHSG